MQELSIDIETYSSVDLIKSGVYAYVNAPDFDILLFAYAFGDSPVEIVDLTAEKLPQQLLEALTSDGVMKTAYNANFERTCLQEYLQIQLPAEQWRCSGSSRIRIRFAADTIRRGRSFGFDRTEGYKG